MKDSVREETMPNGNRVRVVYDECPESPREWDNLWTLVLFHKRYTLGDQHSFKAADYQGWDEMEEAIQKEMDAAMILPVGMLDHSSVHLYVGSGSHPCDSGGWDSGQVGFAVLTREKARNEYGRLTQKRKQQAERILQCELDSYTRYLNGEVYGFIVEDPEGNHLDSCFGIDDPVYALVEGKRSAEAPCPKLVALQDAATSIA